MFTVALVSTTSCLYLHHNRLDALETRLTQLLLNNTALQRTQDNISRMDAMLGILDARAEAPLAVHGAEAKQ